MQVSVTPEHAIHEEEGPRKQIIKTSVHEEDQKEAPTETEPCWLKLGKKHGYILKNWDPSSETNNNPCR